MVECANAYGGPVYGMFSAMKQIYGVIILCLICALPAFPQVTEADLESIRQTKVITAVRITEEITLDGRLEETAWDLATPAKDFTQRIPRFGAPPSEPTEFRILYDDNNLYFGADRLRLGSLADCCQRDRSGFQLRKQRRRQHHYRQPARPAIRVWLCRESCRRDVRRPGFQRWAAQCRLGWRVGCQSQSKRNSMVRRVRDSIQHAAVFERARAGVGNQHHSRNACQE